MTAVVETASEQALGSLRAAVDSLLAADLSRLSQDELLDTLRGLDTEARAIAAVQHRLTAEVAARNVAGELKYCDMASLLAATLLLTRGQANNRVNAAELLAPRVSLLGEPLPPVLPATAAALTDRRISPAHTGVIRQLIRELPAPVGDQHQATAEALLAEHATGMDTAQLRQAATRILGYLHPDGTLTPDGVHRPRRVAAPAPGRLRRRSGASDPGVFRVVANRAGTAGPETSGRRLRTRPAHPRPAPARRARGRPETVIADRRTAHHPRGGDHVDDHHDVGPARNPGRAGHHPARRLISIPEALRLAADGKALPVVLNDAGGILAYGSARRLASPGQRLALMARDKGCTFPGATTPYRPYIDPQRKPQRNRVHRV